jgi:cytochrome P450
MTTAPSCPVDASFDPLSPAFLADPYAVMSAPPVTGTPVFYAPSIGYYVITSYADIEAVFRDPATYSAAVAQAPLVQTPRGSCSGAATRPRRPWSAWTSLSTPGSASRPPARSA